MRDILGWNILVGLKGDVHRVGLIINLAIKDKGKLFRNCHKNRTQETRMNYVDARVRAEREVKKTKQENYQEVGEKLERELVEKKLINLYTDKSNHTYEITQKVTTERTMEKTL